MLCGVCHFMKHKKQIITLIVIGLTLNSCSNDSPNKDKEIGPIDQNRSLELFTNQALQSSIKFKYNTGSTGKLFLAEIVGGGAAFFDCDNDGDLDILFNQGAEISNQVKRKDSQPVLLRNNLNNGKNQLTFTDITLESGITKGHYGIGVAIADVNNDGNIDAYLTNFGSNRLYENRGNCKFKEIKGQLLDNNWSVSASFLDVQNDGYLDLFVGNYVDHSNNNNRTCRNAAGQIDYCGPKAYTPQSNSLWLNHGSFIFSDSSIQSNINQESGGALGVITSDFNDDNLIDIYVANDQHQNFLWQNNADGTFTNTALMNGCAVNSSGLAEASMGVALGDINNDGIFDLFMTHLRQETNTFFSIKNGQCYDKSNKSNLAAASVPFTGFGTGFLDFDNDTDLDLFVANGEIESINEQVKQGDPFPLKQINQLFINNGTGTFNDLKEKSGIAINTKYVSRGAVFGDIDNDGDTDILVINSNDYTQLLINTVGQDNNWIGFDVYYDDYNRHAIGSIVEITLSDGKKQMRRVATDGSYASANDARILFGLGKHSIVSKIKVKWSNGESTLFRDLDINHYYKLTNKNSDATKL